MDTEKAFVLRDQNVEFSAAELSPDEVELAKNYVELTRHLQEIRHLYLMLQYCLDCIDSKYTLMSDGKMLMNNEPAITEADFIAINTMVNNLISAGKNWFNTSGSCEVILSDTAEIDFWKQLPNSREAKIETLELTDFPVRPDRTTRVRITAKPISDDKIEIEIKDLGFGEFFRSSDRVWHCTMSM